MTCYYEKSTPDGMAVCPKCIKDIWLFSEFDTEDMATLTSVGRRKTYRQGDVLFHQGNTSDSIFLIKSRRNKLSKIFKESDSYIMSTTIVASAEKNDKYPKKSLL